MSQEMVERQLQRLEALLSPERTKGHLEKTEPEYSPEELGALAGVGYWARNPDVRVSIYIFPNWNKHREVSAQLQKAYADDSGVYVRTATNGPMLFFAHTRSDSADSIKAKFRLGDIMSAFAGDE